MRSYLPRLRNWLEGYPCLVIFLGILNGFAGYYLFPGKGYGILFLTAVPGLLLAWGLFGLPNCCRRFVPAVILAIFSALLHQSFRSQDFDFAIGPTGKRGAEALFQLKDSSLCGGVPDRFRNAPYYIQAELKGIFDPGTGQFSEKTGNVLLTVSPGSQALESAGYNDLIRCEGYFSRIPQKILHGTFDFESYALARGSSMLFHAESFELERRGGGLLRRLYDLRGHVLSDLIAGMESERAAEMAPALFFGIRQTIPRDLKNDFLLSGTLHILSVSGFHIGLFFLAVMFFFRWIPYHIRWFAAPVPVFIYAVSTGIQAPAFRSFIMLLCWCLSHVFLKKNKSGNVLATAAILILLIQPYQLFDTGFLYSFGCVFFLIFSTDFFRRINSALLVREQFQAERKRVSLLRARNSVILATGTAVTAWLCGMELTLLFQSLFTPYAVPAYLLMSPAVLICFLLFLPGLFLSGIPGVTECFGELMEFPLWLTAEIAEMFSGFGALYVPPPPIWLVILFLASVAGVLLFRQKRFLYLSAAVMFVSGVFSLFPLPVPEPEIAVIRQGGAPEPAVVFCDPVSRRAYLWNLPFGRTSQLVSDYLRTRGIGEVEEIHLDSVRKEICGGTELFLKRTGSKAVYFSAEIPGNAKTALELRKAVPRLDSAPVMKLQREKDTVSCVPGIAGMEGILLRKKISEDSGIILECERDGKLLFRKEIPYSNALILERFPIKPAQKKEVPRPPLSR